MHIFSAFHFRGLIAGAALFFVSSAMAADPALSASELAGRLSALQQDSYVRLRMDVQPPGGAPKTTLQLQIKTRRTKALVEVLYQVLWPKERKGEAVLLRKAAGHAGSGQLFLPPDKLRTLDAAQMKEPIFESDLSYEDVLDDFFTWDQQTLLGVEVIDRVSCQILESRPGKAAHSSYASVRTWVDMRRLVPLRVEKYNAAGGLLRRIDTTNVARIEERSVPSDLSVRSLRAGSVTALDGSRFRNDVVYSDRDFSAEGMRDVSPPRSAP